MLSIRECRLSVSQCAILEQSLMYHDLEHKNIYYCDGTNLKDLLKKQNQDPDTNPDLEDGKNPIADIAIANLAIIF